MFTKQAQLEQLVADGKGVFAKADSEGRDITSDEATQVKQIIDQATRLRDEKTLRTQLERESGGIGDPPLYPATGQDRDGARQALLGHQVGGLQPPDLAHRGRPVQGGLDAGRGIGRRRRRGHAHRDAPRPPLGADQRVPQPSLRQEPVDADVTSISTFRQKSRTLADPSDMIRAIAQTDAKPETDTEAELSSNEALHQIAVPVSTGVANVMLENDAFLGVDQRRPRKRSPRPSTTTSPPSSPPRRRPLGLRVTTCSKPSSPPPSRSRRRSIRADRSWAASPRISSRSRRSGSRGPTTTSARAWTACCRGCGRWP